MRQRVRHPYTVEIWERAPARWIRVVGEIAWWVGAIALGMGIGWILLTTRAQSAELYHWTVLATDTHQCSRGLIRSNWQNPEGRTIYIRKMDFFTSALIGREAGINTYLDPGWSQRTPMPFHIGRSAYVPPYHWFSFDPHYISLPPEGRLYFEYWCDRGIGEFYLTVYYTLEP